MKKRLLAVLVAAVTAVSLLACGGRIRQLRRIRQCRCRLR